MDRAEIHNCKLALPDEDRSPSGTIIDETADIAGNHWKTPSALADDLLVCSFNQGVQNQRSALL